jgi:predicted nucleic acid-binding protein
MILVDTNIFIEVYKGNQVVRSQINTAVKEDVICTSSVCAAELIYGSLNKRELGVIKKDLSGLQIIHIDTAISTLAIQLIEKYILSHMVSFADFLIAATCLHLDIPIFTFNRKDFKFITGIQFYQ